MGRKARRGTTLIGVALAIALVGGGCKRPVSSEVAEDPRSPAETARAVHQYRVSGQLKRMEPYLLPEQRPHVIELLQAVDQLIAAQQVLRVAVGKHMGPATAEVFDEVETANMLGLFSKDVSILEERITGATAVVTIQVAGRVPLEQVRFIRHDERWVLVEDAPIVGLAREIRNLADVHIAVARRLEDRPMTVAQLQQELAMRRAPIQRRLAELYQRAQAPPPFPPAARP